MNLGDLKTQLERKRQAIERLEEECEKILQTMKEHVANQHDWNAEDLEISEAWECEKGGFCVYNIADEEGGGRDECLFCGKPEERL